MTKSDFDDSKKARKPKLKRYSHCIVNALSSLFLVKSDRCNIACFTVNTSHYQNTEYKTFNMCELSNDVEYQV